MSRRIIGAAIVSLDGVMQAPGGPDEDTTGGFAHGGWFAALFEESVGHQVDTVFKPPFALVRGRFDVDEGCSGCVPEVCDGMDNDCDSEVDDGCPVLPACVPSPETCDGADNDCDLVVDEGCPTPP